MPDSTEATELEMLRSYVRRAQLQLDRGNLQGVRCALQDLMSRINSRRNEVAVRDAVMETRFQL